MLIDTIKQEILSRIEEKNLTIGLLERKAKLPNNTIRNIISGTSKNPGINSLTAIAKVLECSVDELLGKKIESRTGISYLRLAEHSELSLELFKEIIDFIESYIKQHKVKISFEDFLFFIKESYIFALNKNSKKVSTSFVEWIIENRK